MHPHVFDLDQPIVALSSPPGPGPRCVVRLSGQGAWPLAEAMLDGEPAWAGRGGLDGPGFRVLDVAVRLGSRRMPGQLALFRGPRSFTTQDVAEFHLPGGHPVGQRLVEQLIAAGARAADPGEFTLRAVLGGRLDLTGAEAVAELISARSDGQLRAAMQLAGGRLATLVAGVTDALADTLAQIEAGLDFADEPIEFVSAETAAGQVATAREQLANLSASAGRFESLEHRPVAALIGRPNVGKSTLLNRLAGVDRALCSPLPGTTRDILSAPLTLPEGEVTLLDSAGLDESASDPDEQADARAQAAARRTAELADLLIFVLDGSADPQPQLALLADLRGDRPTLRVRNKVDRLATGQAGWPGWLDLSAANGQGVESLRAAIGEALFAGSAGSADRPGEQIMLNARHRAALTEADAALSRAEHLLGGGQPLSAVADLLSQELAEAVDQLGQISGRVMTEDILDRIFSRFCIGK